MQLITNRNNIGRIDNMDYYLKEACKNTRVKIAVAFFTDYKLIEKLLENGCSIDLIVRLNDGTSPEALSRIYKKTNVRVCYFTSRYFHPKLYLIPNICAFVGSSNLTNCAMTTNNEINLKVDVEEDAELFDELEQLFMEYWSQAMPLEPEKLKEFEKCMAGRAPGYRDFSKELGDVYFNNVVGGVEKSKKDSFIDEFKKKYLLYVDAFRKLEKMYETTNDRRWKNVPLRIEVDRFLWWIGETQYSKEEWNINEEYPEEKILGIVKSLKPSFLTSDIKWLNSATNNYFDLNETFGSESNIDKLTDDELFDALCNVYSFHDSRQWHKGGLETLKKDFFEANEIKKIKNTIKYLIYGKDSYIERIFNCMFLDEYKLNCFGKASIKELYGYMNKDEFPIYNGRVMKSMSYLGFGKY